MYAHTAIRSQAGFGLALLAALLTVSAPSAAGPLPGPAARAMVFYDDFSGPDLDPRRWAESAQTAALIEPAPEGLALRAGAELTTTTLSLAGRSGAELTVLVVRRAAGEAAWLAIDARTPGGEWIPLDRLWGAARPAERYTLWSVLLPQAALHESAALRFRCGGEGQAVQWVLGDMTLSAEPRPAELAVRIAPPVDAPITVLCDAAGSSIAVLAPFERPIAPSATLRLVAPSTAGANVFSHWTLNGIDQPPRQRTLTIESAEDQLAVAHYAPAAAATLATVTVSQSPPLDAPLWVGPDAATTCELVYAGTTLTLTDGELLAARAAGRLGAYAFERWRIDGHAAPAGQLVVVQPAYAGAVWVAEYGLLGDMNDDRALDKYDVDAFILALSNPGGYERLYPAVARTQRGDVNGDGELDERDVAPFVELLLGE